jgi:hypothetical protein
MDQLSAPQLLDELLSILKTHCVRFRPICLLAQRRRPSRRTDDPDDPDEEE